MEILSSEANHAQSELGEDQNRIKSVERETTWQGVCDALDSRANDSTRCRQSPRGRER